MHMDVSICGPILVTLLAILLDRLLERTAWNSRTRSVQKLSAKRKGQYFIQLQPVLTKRTRSATATLAIAINKARGAGSPYDTGHRDKHKGDSGRCEQTRNETIAAARQPQGVPLAVALSCSLDNGHNVSATAAKPPQQRVFFGHRSCEANCCACCESCKLRKIYCLLSTKISSVESSGQGPSF